jgi:nucleotide-binding universal stress UspA family protein
MKIMAAVDMSDYSNTVVRYSVNLAAALGADVIVTNVVSSNEIDAVHQAFAAESAGNMYGLTDFSLRDYVGGLERTHLKSVNELIGKVPKGKVKCNASIRVGVPHQELLREIKEKEIDMVVVGIKGRSNIADVVMGSVARKMARRSPVPVVSIPADYNIAE